MFKAIGITPIFWPANSPNLNPIETIWDLIKNHIQRHFLEVHRSYKRLREAVQDTWESIIVETVRELIRSMVERCIDVIVADSGYTKW